MMSDWLELGKAADLLGIHFTTLRRWADAGEVPCIRTPGGHRRFQRADLEAFLAKLQGGDSDPAVGLKEAERRLTHGLSQEALREEPWFSRLDEVERTAMRAEGQQLMAVLMQYASRQNGGEAFLQEGERLARHYGRICQHVGLSLSETVRGFTLVRRAISDSVYKAGTIAGRPDTESWQLYGRMNNFLDAMLLAIIQAYEGSRKE
jgi:excisionase family DNA binding protein